VRHEITIKSNDHERKKMKGESTQAFLNRPVLRIASLQPGFNGKKGKPAILAKLKTSFLLLPNPVFGF